MFETRIDHSSEAEKKLLALVEPILKDLGYDTVALLLHRHKGTGKLQLFIDRLTPGDAIGVEDCANVSRALDPVLDQSAEMESIFPASYELEVSSPGIERPLTRLLDFNKFEGQRARIHTLRSLTADELNNSEYHSKNTKQKNFVGILAGVIEPQQQIKITIKNDEIRVPFELITKATLDPDFDQVLSKKGNGK